MENCGSESFLGSARKYFTKSCRFQTWGVLYIRLSECTNNRKKIMTNTELNIPQLKEEIDLLHGQICYALREPVRIMMLYLIGEQDRYVNEIAELLELPQSTTSRHLAVLRERGLVNTERRGTSVFYTLSNPHIIFILDEMRKMMKQESDNEK